MAKKKYIYHISHDELVTNTLRNVHVKLSVPARRLRWICTQLPDNQGLLEPPVMGARFSRLLLLSLLFVDRFYIALFSALGQTHCARM